MDSPHRHIHSLPARLLPGLALCGAVTLAAVLLQAGEQHVVGRVYLEALVLAILVGSIVRTLWVVPERYQPGIHFSAKTLLEVAVVLLGLSVDAKSLIVVGPKLLLSIAALVLVAIAVSYTIGRAMGLPKRLSILIACGNSICGNSAIAAVAPVIHADSDDVSASIAFTAILGVATVLGLPLLMPLLSLSGTQYGVLAGLTVYAVPQVLAATSPMGLLATQIGTLVKLVRVLMLGPVILLLSLGMPKLLGHTPEGATIAMGGEAKHRTNYAHLVPWFIVGFLALACLRSADLIPQAWIGPSVDLATMLTVFSMAALGLGVDIRTIGRAGPRVTFVVAASLLTLIVISVGLIHGLGIV